MMNELASQNVQNSQRQVVVRTLSTSEFARALGLSDSTVRRLTDSGELEVHRTRGGHRRIPVSEAIRYIRSTQARIVYPEMLGLDGSAQTIGDQPACPLPDRPELRGPLPGGSLPGVPAAGNPAAGNELIGGKPGSPELCDAELVRPETWRAESSEMSMLRVLEAGHAMAVVGLMQWLFASGMSVAELCDGPIAFALRRIGERWPHDKRAIFVEHRATILCGRALNQLRMSIPSPDEDAPKAIGGAMSGDIYLLPTLMASLVLHENGFNETNLGPNTPLDVLADALIDEQPDLIWLSISEPLRSNSHRAELLKLAEVAEQHQTKFIVGGRQAADLASIQMNQDGKPRWTVCQSMVELGNLV